jgi:P-type conjugative transfer protein TrbJ
MKARIIYLAMLSMVTVPAFAGTVAGFGGSTEVTQILNNIELITQTAQQVKMVEVQLQQAMTNPNTPWSQTMQALTTLRSAVQQGQAIGYSLASVEKNFANTYQGYTRSKDMIGDFIRWNNVTRDSINGALRAAGTTADQIATEDGMIDRLRMMGQSAQGQMQAAQVGNAIAIEMVQQMRQLRQLQAAQMQAHNSFMAGQAQESATNKAAEQAFLQREQINLKGKALTIK